MLHLPSDDVLYDAMLNRDPLYDGRAYVAVASTGIFCRIVCPARKPKRENCTFYETVAECLQAGYRACKRCRPLAPAATAEPLIGDLMQALEADPTRRWTESDVVARGYDPSTVRRAFKRHLGTTFLDLARQARLRAGLSSLSGGAKVIDAQLDAGFDSASGFRDAVARLLGEAPANLTADAPLRMDWIATPLGAMIAVADRRNLHLLEFHDRKALAGELRRLRQGAEIGLGRFPPIDQVEAELKDFFAGRGARFSTPLVYHGTPFTRRVWGELRRIPAGETRSYRDVARAIGQPTATRAVARANGANQIALVIPCHRVIGADGTLTGYGGGLWRKQRLIELERGYAVAGAMAG